jgi:hypothetical protein
MIRIGRRNVRRATAAIALVAGAATSLLLSPPAHAELRSRQQVEHVPGGQVRVGSRAWEDVPGDPAPASVDDLEFVDAAQALLPAEPPPHRRFPACRPTSETPAVGEVHVCSSWTVPVAAPEAAASATDPAAIARRAAAELLAEPGTVGILPARTLTGLETYYWIGGVGRRSTTCTQSGLTLRIEATPVGYEWDFGDGTLVHDGPGTQGPPGASEVRHVYRRSDIYRVSALVTWSVTFGLNGVTSQLPDAFTTTATADLAVDELRARLTG